MSSGTPGSDPKARIYQTADDFSRVFRASRLHAAAIGRTQSGIDDVIWALQVISTPARSLLIDLGATMPGDQPPAFTPELLEAFHAVVPGEEVQPLMFGNLARLEEGRIDSLFLIERLIETNNPTFGALLESAGIEPRALLDRIQQLRP